MTVPYGFNDTTEQLMIANDPKVTWLDVRLTNPGLPNLAFRLGRALHKSTHIHTLHINVACFDNEEEESSILSILQWISTSLTLTSILIGRKGGDHSRKRHEWFLAALCNRGLLSLSPLKTISIWYVEVCASTFVRILEVCRPEGLTFTSSWHNRSFANRNDAVERVRNAISTNTSLRVLCIDAPKNPEGAEYFCAILEALPPIVRLRKLGMNPQMNSRGTVAPQVLDAIVSRLQSQHDRMEGLELTGFRWTETTSTLASAIDRLRPFEIENLAFQRSEFDEASSLHLLSIFGSQCNHDTVCPNGLHVRRNVVFPDSVPVLERLAGSSPRLVRLNMAMFHTTLSQNNMTAILNGLMSKSSSLHEINFGKLRSAECSALLDGIPSFRKLNRLQFEMNEESTLLKKKLLKAAKLNGSIKHYTIAWPSLTEEDKGRLRQYLRRNCTLPDELMTHTATTKSEDRSNTRDAGFAIVPDLLHALIEATSTADGIAQVLPCLMRCGVRIGRYQEGQAKRDRDEPSHHQDEEPPREAKRPRRSDRFASKANDGDETGK